MRRTLTIVTATAAVAAVALTAGCGSSSSSSAPAADTTTAAATTAPETTAPATTTTPAATASTVQVLLGKPKEFSLGAAPAAVPAGKVTFVVKNQGKILHEMVVVPGASAAALKQPNGEASETGSPGEVPDVKPGKGGKVTINLPAGQYVLLCNLPGHFAGGMYTTFTVS